MNPWARVLAVVGLGLIACSAKGPPEARGPRQAVNGGVPPERGLLVARMEEEISTSEHQAGKRFRASLAAPFSDEEGTIHVVPPARVVGSVTELKRGHGARPGVIALRLDEIIKSPSERYRLSDAPVTALDVEQGAPELDDRTLTSGIDGGLLVGTLLGGAPTILISAAVGSAAGVTHAAHRRVVDARVDAKSFVTAQVHEVTRE